MTHTTALDDLDRISRELERFKLDAEEQCSQMLERLREIESDLALAVVTLRDHHSGARLNKTLDDLDKKTSVAALCALIDLDFQLDPDGTRTTLREFFRRPLSDEDKAILEHEGVSVPHDCATLEAIILRGGKLPADSDSPEPGTDDSAIGHLCEVIDGLRQQNDLLRAALAERDDA